MYFDIVKLDPVNNYCLFTLDQLILLKQSISQENLDAYIEDMKMLFDAPLETVTSKEHSLSLNKHDYVSLATYYWPDPSKPDGLPYIQKDGYANPEGQNYDKDKLRRLAHLVYHASILYYLTGHKTYQRLIQKHLEHFFIDPKTKMNPNLDYGQFIRGHQTGRKEGIIDYAANFTYALNILMHLESLKLIDDVLMTNLRSWHQDFLEWLMHSKIGSDEAMALNNHGTFYDLTCVVISKFVQKNANLSNWQKKFKERINYQIDIDGAMPLELKRTKSLSYSFMNLKGLIELNNQLDLKSPLKLVVAIKWLIEQGINNTWRYEQVTPVDPGIYLLHQSIYKDLYGIDVKLDINHNNVINKTLWYLHKK